MPAIITILISDGRHAVNVTVVPKKQQAAYKHLGFWKAMDTLNDKNYLEDLWSKPKCPWKIW
jgi:glucose-1-phosphate cytidylyltransferase